MMTIAEQIYAIVNALPQERASEILAFAQLIRAKSLNEDSRSDSVNSSISWTELVYSLAGTWAQDFPTLEEIRLSSGQDIVRESL